jgi:hypothetical protein
MTSPVTEDHLPFTIYALDPPIPSKPYNTILVSLSCMPTLGCLTCMYMVQSDPQVYIGLRPKAYNVVSKQTVRRSLLTTEFEWLTGFARYVGLAAINCDWLCSFTIQHPVIQTMNCLLCCCIYNYRARL